MTRSVTRFLLSALALGAGCAPRFVVRPPAAITYAIAGPVVKVGLIHDLRPDPRHVSTGYVGIFQQRQELRAHHDTPPAQVLGQALSDELYERGMTNPSPEVTDVICTLPEFLLRYRNYVGAYSATDAWGYLDLNCQVRHSGVVIWAGVLSARYHRVYYTLMQEFPDAIWPSLSGALIQQSASILNRLVFHAPASQKTLERAAALLGSKKEDERFDGAYLLGITGDPGVIGMLMPALEDPSKKVRRSVVDALGTLGARAALPALLSRYDGEDGNVQWATLKAILQIGDPQGFAWLRAHAPSIKADTLREIVDDVLAHDPGAR